MKQLSTLVIMALVLSLGFSACSKDKGEPEPEKEVSLEGKWIGTEVKMEFFLDKTLVETFTVPKEALWEYMIFSPNKAIIKTPHGLIETELTIIKNTIVLKTEDQLLNFEYLISKNKLALMSSAKDIGTTNDDKEYNNVKVTYSFVKEE